MQTSAYIHLPHEHGSTAQGSTAQHSTAQHSTPMVIGTTLPCCNCFTVSLKSLVIYMTIVILLVITADLIVVVVTIITI